MPVAIFGKPKIRQCQRHAFGETQGMIEFQHFKKSYGRTLVLDIPAFEIPRGIHWLKGVNGVGKTTLFKSLAGLLQFDGDVILDGSIQLSKAPLVQRRWINYAEAEPVYPHFLTGQDFVNLFVAAKNAPKTQADNILERFQMNSYIKQPVGTYSSGMQKKLSLTLAFLGQPKIILLDEPLITIDDISTDVIYDLVKEYHERQQVTFLISTHQAVDNMKLDISSKINIANKNLVMLP